MRCLIDKSVLNAEPYYRTMAREPSPAGDITISPNDLRRFSDLDLKTVLTEMKALGAKGRVAGRYPLESTWPQDAAGEGRQCRRRGIEGQWLSLLKSASGIARREAIRAMPADKKPKAWQAWFKDFDPGVKIEERLRNQPWLGKRKSKSSIRDWYERQGKQILEAA